MKLITFLVSAMALTLGLQASAKQIIYGDAAQKLYVNMVELQKTNPNEITSFVSGYFGDLARPELGKLWVTTIYPTATKDIFCYEYDFRESNVKEYQCEIESDKTAK